MANSCNKLHTSNFVYLGSTLQEFGDCEMDLACEEVQCNLYQIYGNHGI